MSEAVLVGETSLAERMRRVAARVPWLDFLMGLAVPLEIIHVAGLFGRPLAGAGLALAFAAGFFAVNYAVRWRASIFAVVTFIMIATQTGAAALGGRSEWAAFVPGADNLVLGLVFAASALTAHPIILKFIDERSLARIPEEVRRSPHFLEAWQIVTAMWGAAYFCQSAIVTWLSVARSPVRGLVNYAFGWPVVLALLFVSVTLPGRYWRKRLGAPRR